METILKLFKCGHFENCLLLIRENVPKELSELTNLSETAAGFLLENNKIVCLAIIEPGKDEQKWLNTLQLFIKLYSNYRSLLVIPLDLEMNVIHNMLWWYWIKPQSIQSNPAHTTYHLNSIVKLVSCCLIKVLRSSGEVVLDHQICPLDTSSLVSLLKRASDQLLCQKPVACLQLLDIITMILQVFLRERIFEATTECMSFMKKMVEQIDLLRLHTEQKQIVGNEEFYFKFGLKCINSTASLRNCRDSIDAFIITSSLVCASNEEYEHAINCLKGISEGGSFTFIMNYLKAHCCLMSQHYSEAKLSLAYVMSGSVPPLQLAYYRLLLARLLSAQDDCQAALVQCDAVLASHPAHAGLTSLAAHLAAQQAKKLNITTAELNYLRILAKCLKPESSQDREHFESFEECCILILSRQFSSTLLEALYTLARELYLAGYHVKSLDGYKEVLELIKSPTCEMPLLLPCRSQLIHECVLAHIKSNSLQGGEQLCRQLVNDHMPHSGGGEASCSSWEMALYSMEDDVIALILLADILTASGNKKKALEELNRCQSALTEWREQTESETNKELCDWLLSRVLLRKAKISSTNDAVHYFRRALLHKPGDKEVMFHYKQWSLWHPDHESFDPGDAAAAVTFPVAELHNLAVSHVIGCSISEEEWNHLFDRETSQNIIESLFDDDD